MPVAILGSAIVLARRPRIAAGAVLALVPLLVGMWLTYSRAALLSLFVIAVLVAWRFQRRLGVALLVVGIVGAFILLPSYLQLRSQSALEGAVEPGEIVVASDRLRFAGWEAAARMVANRPLTGQGFLAYKEVADRFGDPVLGSPHNEWLRLFAEEGLIVGTVGLLFLATTLWRLGRDPDWLATGILAGFSGYAIMASFNNPLLFIQVSAIVFPIVGFGLARARAPAQAMNAPPATTEAA
jgi:O-antigen ligase